VGLILACATIACALASLLNNQTADNTQRPVRLLAIIAMLWGIIIFIRWVWSDVSAPIVVMSSKQPGQRNGGADPNATNPYMPMPAPMPVLPEAPRTLPNQRAPMTGPTSATPPDPRSPFENDQLFDLSGEQLGNNVRLFRVSKDKSQLCQDGFACDSSRGIYAVTDGVSNSRMPAPWARIVARNFVQREPTFSDSKDFARWLSACRRDWRLWMYEHWAAKLSTEPSGNPTLTYWLSEVWKSNAQTTLVACALNGKHVAVTAVGDSECLIFSGRGGDWRLKAARPLNDPGQFNDTPSTLITDNSSDIVKRMVSSVKVYDEDVQRGDLVVLATDSVAKWLLAQSLAANGKRAKHVTSNGADAFTPDWHLALTMRDQAEFEQLVEREYQTGRMDKDDYTLLVIPIE
jgi:hypothetical protein